MNHQKSRIHFGLGQDGNGRNPAVAEIQGFGLPRLCADERKPPLAPAGRHVRRPATDPHAALPLCPPEPVLPVGLTTRRWVWLMSCRPPPSPHGVGAHWRRPHAAGPARRGGRHRPHPSREARPARVRQRAAEHPPQWQGLDNRLGFLSGGTEMWFLDFFWIVCFLFVIFVVFFAECEVFLWLVNVAPLCLFPLALRLS